MPPTAAQSTPGNKEIARLSTRVAQLALLIEDAQQMGNRAAEYSLQVQYHQASAADPRAWTRTPGTEMLRKRHEERAAEFQALLDEIDE